MQKKLGFLNFGHFAYDRATGSVDPKAAFDDQLEMTVAAEEEGLDGAWIRVHHFQWMISAPFPTLAAMRSEEHTSELQSRGHLVCRLLLEKNILAHLTR